MPMAGQAAPASGFAVMQSAMPPRPPMYKQRAAPIQVRKSFPESWIFENFNDVR